MRAIIVAAGMGRRLAPYTDDRPKCLVDVNGKSILQRQIDAYHAAGVDEIVLIRGYRKEQLTVPGARYFDNDDYQHNNILTSLFYAEDAMAGGFLMSYSDIVFRPSAVTAALNAQGDYALVIDRKWRDVYEGRSEHPISEAEVARTEGDRVLRVGKKTVPSDEATGEFIGLARFSATAVDQMRARFHARKKTHAGKPYGTAARFEVAYVTDLLNDLIDDGVVMTPAFIDGEWREIDTTQDLARAKEVVAW